MRRYWVLAVVGLVLGISPASGQGSADGSLYSRYGLGELRSFASSRAQAMGGGGVALWSLNYANYANPAALSRQFLVRASAGMRFDNIVTVDAWSREKNLMVGSLAALQFGLPLLSNTLGLGFAFEPFSRISYKVTSTGELETDPVRSPREYTVVTQGAGGLQQLRLGVGVRPLSAISVGLSADYLFGIVEDSRLTTFEISTLVNTNVARKLRMRGLAITAGVIASIPTDDDNELSAAVSVRFPAVLNARSVRTVGESLDLDTLGTVTAGDISLPTSVSGGIAFTTDSRWSITADISYEPWTNFTSDLALTGYTPETMQDRTRISAGAEWLPAGSNVIESYLARVAYRLGFYVDNAYISPVAGENVLTRAITAGLSLPSMFGGTRLDINVQLGLRGSTTGILVQDRFLILSATLNVGERWFLKRRLG